MRRSFLKAACSVALGAGLLAFTKSAMAEAAKDIPPDQTEPPPPPPPGPRYVWEPGHWHWNGLAYVWVRGHYVIRGAAWHRFVPGHWGPRGGVFVWIPAHWE